MKTSIRSLVIAAALALAGPALAQPVGIGTSPQGTLTYTLGATYAKALQDATGLQARVQPSSGTGVMVPLVETGELDMGFVNTLELSEAYNGTGSFQGRPNKNLRAIAVLFPIRVGLFVRKDAPYKTVADLKGKSLAYGYTSQAIIKTVLDGILANAGLTPGDIKPVLVPNLIRGVDEFTAGNVDAGFFALGQAKVSEADAAVGGIRFLPMSDAAGDVAAMRKVVPTAYIDTVKPAPNLPGVAGELKTMFYDYVMFVNARLPADKVKRMTSVLADKQAEMAEAMPLFRSLVVARMNRALDVPFHDGAKAFYAEKGIAVTQ